MTGISGSGKSSLAFDTVFAEGQRRYVDNLSSFAKQVIGVVEKPDVDSIEGVPPAISIDQKSISRSPRSTVGTMTESYDFLRLLFSRFGKVQCIKCKNQIISATPERITLEITKIVERSLEQNQPISIFVSFLSKSRGKDQLKMIEKLLGIGFDRFIINGKPYRSIDLENQALKDDRDLKIEAVLWEDNEQDKKLPRSSLIEKITVVLRKSLRSADLIIRASANDKNYFFSNESYCANCGEFFPAVQPRLFSFNSPYGACPACQGLGVKKEVDRELVIPNKKLTLDEGAIRPWSRLSGQNGWLIKSLEEFSKRKNIPLDIPVEELSDAQIDKLFSGDEGFEGITRNLERKYLETDSDYLRQEIEQYMNEEICDLCDGKRLNKYALSVTVYGKNIADLSDLEATTLFKFLEEHKSESLEGSNQIVNELKKRLNNLIDVGLGYLTLSRSSESLSGGEAQRIRLGVQFDSFLSGVLYVLDEPTIGLHPIDTERIIKSLVKLKEEGNTVLVVEHDPMIIKCADYIFDMGPGAGKEGGLIVAEGTPEQIMKNKNSVTGGYLVGKKKIDLGKMRKRDPQNVIFVEGARHNNLKNINIEIPLGLFVCVSGVSGSGKSSLVYDILAKALAMKLHQSQDEPGEYENIKGIQNIDKVIKIDQDAIGRTPRSNLATYTGIFSPIRELFAQTDEAKAKGFNASRFSFNLKGGRCETCRGDGAIKVEMYFMPDVYVPCEECGGKRYNNETLEIKYKERSISDVLDMGVDEAYDFFSNIDELKEKLKILRKVGLGYMPLGQSANTMSGGEAQRIKLASELSRPSTGKTIYILDEPTVGLHFDDIKKLLIVLQELVDRGNTVLVIEHSVDVLKNSDWVIDMGPGGGEKGGEIVAVGPPDTISKTPESVTGKFLE